MHIELNNITVGTRKKSILEIYTLSISRNQFAAIIGPNGAGKTTLLKLICSLQKPDSGTIQINGSKKIGYVPQRADYNSSLPFTVSEIAVMGRAATKPIFTQIKKEDYEIADSWLNALGLGDKINQTFRSLSGGEQQKTLIASAMAAQPEILLLDEPTANLDFMWKKELVDILDFVHSQNPITALMVSHEINLLPKSCDRIILLDKGKIIADQKPENLSFDDIVKKYKPESLTPN